MDYLPNPFMPSGFFYYNSLDRFISFINGVRLVIIIVMFCRKLFTYANSVDSDHMMHSVACDLGLHCL